MKLSIVLSTNSLYYIVQPQRSYALNWRSGYWMALIKSYGKAYNEKKSVEKLLDGDTIRINQNFATLFSIFCFNLFSF